MNLKKLLAALLTLALLLGVLPMTASAQEFTFSIEGPRLESSLTRGAAATPVLSAGNHQSYLDRVASLPQYALDYYRWLEDNADANGALADPTLGTFRDGEYYHLVTEVSGSEQFTFSSRDKVADTAKLIAETNLNNAFTSFSAYVGVVRDAFDREHPEVFWLSGRSSCSYLGSWSYSYKGNTCTVTYKADMVVFLQYDGFDIRDSKYLDPKTVASAISTRDAAVQEILSGCPAGTVYEQLVYLNDTLTARNAYNRAVAENRSTNADSDAWECISALAGRSGNTGPVCEGYARAFMVLCQKLDIPCVLVNGNAKSEKNAQPEGHMWNYVQVDGRWYAVDVTWNDPYVASRPEQKKSGSECRNWLLLGSNTAVASGLNFLESHEVTNRVRGQGLGYTNGPVLETSAYDPNQTSRYSISGTVSTVGNETVTVQLWQGSTLKATKTLTGSSVSYRFDGLDAGSYQVTASKNRHVKRSQAVTVSNKSVACNIRLYLLGDVTGDGVINVGDVSKVYSHVRGTAVITDPYILLCADVTGDGNLNMGDTGQLYKTVRS